MGEQLDNPDHLEGPRDGIRGMGLLPVVTTFKPLKRRRKRLVDASGVKGVMEAARGSKHEAVILCLMGFGRSQKDALWKQWEIDFLRENYPDHNKDWEGWKQLDRSWYAIANKAHSMKITMRGRGRPRKVV